MVPLWRRIIFRTLQVLGVLFLLGTIAGATAVAVVYNRTNLTDLKPDTTVTAQTSTAYYADGTFLADWKAVDRTIVTSEQIPEHVKNSFVAAEDRTFYDNRGIDVRGIARAVWGQLRGDPAGGGSTITQQYVRNTYEGLQDQSLRRKANEIILAVKVDRQLEKDQILTDYLNTIYFGRQSYGIQAASKTYFGVSVEQLTPPQAAVLAGILPAPVDLDPKLNPEGAQARFAYVVDGLVATDAITTAEAATFVFPEVLEEVGDSIQTMGPNGYLKTIVREQLEKIYTPEQIDTGGLTITTTFSPVEQQKARDAVLSGLEEALAPTGGAFPTGLRAGLAAIDPATGAVRALYAGEGPEQAVGILDTATKDTYQPGSTMKPFALVAGLGQGKELTDTYSGRSPWSTDTEPPFTFENFGGSQFGRIDLVTATANSVNTVYAQLNAEIGPSASYQAMVDAGLPPGCDIEGSDQADCTNDLAQGEVGNILGSASPHVIDMAQAYATFAANGVRRDWYVVSEVKDPAGTVIWVPDTTGRQVFDPGVIADATYALTQVIQRGSGENELGDIERPIAGKTGTASDNKAASFAGYTPQLATVVALWQKGPDGTSVAELSLPGVNQVTGGSYPARIFNRYITAALDGQPVLEFPEPRVKPAAPRPAAPATTRREEPPPPTEEPEPEPSAEPSVEPTTDPTRTRTGTIGPPTSPTPTTTSATTPTTPTTVSTTAPTPTVPTVTTTAN